MDIRKLIVALYNAGEIPTKGGANTVYSLAQDFEESPEGVAAVMDMIGLNGDAAYDMAMELEEA